MGRDRGDVRLDSSRKSRPQRSTLDDLGGFTLFRWSLGQHLSVFHVVPVLFVVVQKIQDGLVVGVCLSWVDELCARYS